MEKSTISRAVIQRLPRYYRYLGELMSDGCQRISSGELSNRMHVTASQIRQDLNHFGGFGQQGYGYNVEYLYNEIGKILGLDTTHRVIIIGAGNLGTALANYPNFEKRGFLVTALFDVNPERIGQTVGDIPILPLDTLEDYLADHPVHIATLAIPKTAAVGVAERLVACGIRAIWNFAPLDLQLPEGVFVKNVNLIESLMQLSYRLKELK